MDQFFIPEQQIEEMLSKWLRGQVVAKQGSVTRETKLFITNIDENFDDWCLLFENTV